MKVTMQHSRRAMRKITSQLGTYARSQKAMSER